MVGQYKVITLCGSTRFKDEFMEVQKRLTLEGNIVISVGLFGHSGDNGRNHYRPVISPYHPSSYADSVQDGAVLPPAAGYDAEVPHRVRTASMLCFA